MLFFRSEEKVASYCAQRGVAPGAILTRDQLWQLSQAWYGNRADRAFHGRTPAQVEALLTSLGLDTGFWKFAPGA